jgi:hypothetical protein
MFMLQLSMLRKLEPLCEGVGGGIQHAQTESGVGSHRRRLSVNGVLSSSWLPLSSPSSPRAFLKRGQRRRSLHRWVSSPPRRQRRAQRTLLSRRPTTLLLQTQPPTIHQRVRPRQVSPAQPAHPPTAQTIQTALRPSACQTQKARLSPRQRRHGHRAPPRPRNPRISAINLPLPPPRLPSNHRSRHLPPSTSLSHKPSFPTPPHSVPGPQRVAYRSQKSQPTEGQRTR